ncbi:hypothetical protein H0H93_005566 [Arthromyces matolae]|nr:hypothetical protein H0H93_005566 [Arthromyces matolae]
MSETILIPLTQFDQSYLENFSITNGRVVQSLDIDALRAAVFRVVDKWRLLAGYVEWSNTLSKWCIRVPLQGDVSSRFTFTTSKIATRLHPSFVVNEQDPAHISTRPPLQYFRHESVPHDLQTYNSSRSPLFSVHVTELLNCTCVGLTIPHGVFDGGGSRQIIHALNQELHGKPWDPPAISQSNILQEALDDLEHAPSMYNDIHQETATYSALRRYFVPASVINVATLIASILYERARHNVESRAVYLGPKAIVKLRREAKGDLQSSEAPSVSMNNILAAWFFKAIHANETDDNVVALWSYNSIRETLAKKYPALMDYSHNAIVLHPITPFTKEELRTKSLKELAVLHRKALEPAGEIAWVQAYNTYLKKALGGHLILRRSGDDPWIYTNQVISRIDKLDLGSKLYAGWFWTTPHETNHHVAINRFKDGYTIQANAKATRWRAVAKAVEDLNVPDTRL